MSSGLKSQNGHPYVHLVEVDEDGTWSGLLVENGCSGTMWRCSHQRTGSGLAQGKNGKWDPGF